MFPDSSKQYLLDFNWYRAITQRTHPVNVLMSKLGIKIVCKRIPTWRRAWHSYSYGQMVGWMKMPLGRGRPRPWPHCVRWGCSSLSPKGGGAEPPIFGPYLWQPMAGWIKMPLGMEVGLSPGDFVVDGNPINFRPMFITVIVISLEHCTVVIDLFKFKF